MVYLLGKTTFEKKTKRSIPDGAAITEYLQHNYMTDISAILPPNDALYFH